MSTHSNAIEQRYAIELPRDWKQWFDHDCESLLLPGPFRFPIASDELFQDAPRSIWPGMMLPNTLPILSNGYGDWLCVDVTETGTFGELVHWYHGGGDWIPLGGSLADAAIHDCIDCLRPKSAQMLRSALEADSPHALDELEQRLMLPEVQDWLQQSAMAKDAGLDAFVKSVSKRDYCSLLNLAESCQMSVDAIACDRIELLLQPLQLHSALAETRAFRDLDKLQRARLSFDPLHFADSRLDIKVTQDWHAAESIANGVLRRRADLAWAYDISGWAALRQGKFESAQKTFEAGAAATAFSSQAVRLKTHFGGFDHNKFCVARMLEHDQRASNQQTPDLHADEYALLWQSASSDQLVKRVQQHWESKAESALAKGHPDQAYQHWLNAGWDVGFSSMEDCGRILQGLVAAAEAAGWEARKRVAKTHLTCLEKRLSRTRSL